MKSLIWILSATNLYLGLRAFLNVIGITHTSKYSEGATLFFAILFLSMSAGGFYFTLLKPNQKYALLCALGPWVIGFVFLLFNMFRSDYK
jgi:hypothetical protein